MNGIDYFSVRAALLPIGVPLAKRQALRDVLKIKGACSFEHDGRSHFIVRRPTND